MTMTEETESQIAKIQIFEAKSSSSFVHVEAVKADKGRAELYFIGELPMLNPAAAEECEHIILSVLAAFKRAYRYGSEGSENFENAISEINEEMGKLAENGKAHWVSKFSGITAVREGKTLHISTCGKVIAMLIRQGKMSDISCSAPAIHPLRTFENYASGQIALNDLLVFSTSQLYNYISYDRIRQILGGSSFLQASKQIIELLRANGSPQSSFGIILNQQILPGQAENEVLNLDSELENQSEKTGKLSHLLGKLWILTKETLNLKGSRRIPKISLPAVSLGSLSQSGKTAAASIKNAALSAKGQFSREKFKSYSPQKKLALIASVFLFVAILGNIFLAVRQKKSAALQKAFDTQISEAQKLVSMAESSFIYGDEPQAVLTLKEAAQKLPAETNLSKQQLAAASQIKTQIEKLQSSIEKAQNTPVENLGTLGAGSVLIGTSEFLGVQVNSQIISYEKSTGQIQDGVRKLDTPADYAAKAKNSLVVIYSDNGLYVWDAKTGQKSAKFEQSVPAPENFGGMAFYDTNSRIYVVDKSQKRIVSFLVSASGLSRPVVALSGLAELSEAQSLAIDGSLFVLGKKEISHFYAGKKTEFKQPFGVENFSGSGKVFTAAGFKNAYLLDKQNGKLTAFDSKGNIVKTYINPGLVGAADFLVEEQENAAYILNQGNLLKMQL